MAWVKERNRRTRKMARVSIKRTAKERARLMTKNRRILQETK